MLELRPLNSATFRHLAAALWVNEFGNWVGEIALAILVYDRTQSPLATATLFLSLRFLPALLAPILTTRVETMRPRVVLPVIYLVEAVLFAGIALVTRHFSLPVVLVLASLDGLLAITSTALTRGATATHLIGSGMLREGNGLLNLGAMISTAGAPAVAGVLVAWRGPATALFVDAGTFVVTAMIILTARGIRIASDQDAGFEGRLRAGFAVLRERPTVRRLLIAIALVVTLSSVALPIEVVFAKTTLHSGDSGYGLLLTSWGAGMVLGGIAFASGVNRRLITVLGVSTSLVVVGYGGLALSPTLAVACAFSAVGGAGNGAAWVAARTSVQERIPLNTQSAVMAVLEGINQVMPALGFIVGGAVTALSSPRAAYAISAVGVALILIVFTVRPIDRVQLEPVEAHKLPIGPDARSAEEQETEASDRSLAVTTLTIG